MTDADQPRDLTAKPRLRQSTGWTPPRRTIGTVALAGAGFGVGLFVWLLGSAGGLQGDVTVGHILAGIFVLGGLEGGRWGFGSQRAADREAEFMRRIDDDDDRLDELFGEVAELRNTLTAVLGAFEAERAVRERFAVAMEKFLAHEEIVDEQSAKARSDVAEILAGVASLSVDLGGVGATLELVKKLDDRLTLIERKLAIALGENVVDLDTVRAFNRLDQRHQERE